MIIQIFKTLSQDVLYVARYGFRLIKSGSGSLGSYLLLRTGQRIKKRLCGSKRSRPRAERRPCNSFACEAEWVPAAWEDCSANCGKQGKQYRLGGVEHFTVTANSSRGVSSRLLHRCNSTGIEEGKQCSRERISSPNTLTYEKKISTLAPIMVNSRNSAVQVLAPTAANRRNSAVQGSSLAPTTVCVW